MLRVPHLPEKDFKWLLKRAPTLAVDNIITNGKGEFLLEKRTYPPYVGQWHLPGGFVGFGERLKQTAKRKALQETGLKIRIIKYVGYYDDPKQDNRGHVIVISFLSRAVGGKLKPEGLKWFKEIPHNTIWFQKTEIRDAGLAK